MLSKSVIIVIKKKSEEVSVKKRLPVEWIRLQAEPSTEIVSLF